MSVLEFFSLGGILTKWLLAAPEEEWNKLLINGLTIGKGEVLPNELDSVIKKRIERTLIRTVRQIPVFCYVLFLRHISSISTILFMFSHHSYFFLSIFQEGGSYQQRVLTEYLKGIQSRSEEITQVLQGKTQ